MKIVVFDDDPTGSQTVYGCPLLLSWDQDILKKYLNDPSYSLIFLLTNTRSLSPDLAEARLRGICRTLKSVIKKNDFRLDDIYFVSRGDSTLRGHGILEPKVIHEELGPFDATFHIPAFFEGGRTTVNDLHLLNGTPVHQTIFAKDNVFGYKTSHLPNWLAEKSNDAIHPSEVISISIKELEQAKNYSLEMNKLRLKLSTLACNQSVVVNASNQEHLAAFRLAIKSLQGEKRFLFRSAASLINSLSKITSDSNTFNDFPSLRISSSSGTLKPGLVIVGSHVALADEQLGELLKEKSCIGLKLDVVKIAKAFQSGFLESFLLELERSLFNRLLNTLNSDTTPVLYTSRGEMIFSSNSERMKFGICLAELMARLAQKVSNRLGYIISKGGITTHILLSKGLRLKAVYLKGQILPGLSVVCSEQSTNQALPILTFPGNLGDKYTLLKAWKMMEVQSLDLNK